MSFPLMISDRTVQNAPQLAELFLIDVRAGGGRIVAHKPPHRWIADLVETGLLERKLALALAAAMLRGIHPSAASEAARLGVALKSPEIGAILPMALEGLDMGTLLHIDPINPNESVEDALIFAWAILGDRSKQDVRTKMLERARNAGLADVELSVTCTHGEPEELEAWLPSILIGPLPEGGARAIKQCLGRGHRISRTLHRVLSSLPEERKRALWQELVDANPDMAKIGRLRKALAT